MRGRPSVWWMLSVLCAVPLLWVHVSNFAPTPADEATHLYVASRVADGLVLYGDIHSARPPLTILPLAVLLRLGLTPLLAARVLIWIGVAFATVAVARTLYRHVSARGAMIGTALFLLTPDMALQWTYHGLHLGAACVLFGLEAGLSKKSVAAGIWFALSLLCSQQVALLALLCGIFVVVHARADSWKVPLVAAAVFALSIGVLFALGGDDVLHDIIGIHLWHLEGNAKFANLWWRYQNWLLDHSLWILLALATVVLKRADGVRWLRVEVMCLAAAAVHLVVVATRGSGHGTYLSPSVLFLAVAAGATVDRALRSQRDQRWLAAMTALLFCVASGASWRRVQHRYIERDRRGSDHTSMAYPFLPHARAAEIGRLQAWDQLADVAAFVRRSSPKDATVFGDQMFGPWVALASGRRVTGELADFSPNWVRFGQVPSAQLQAALRKDPNGVFIATPGFYTSNKEFLAFLTREYRAHQQAFFPPPVPARGSQVPRVFVLGK